MSLFQSRPSRRSSLIHRQHILFTGTGKAIALPSQQVQGFFLLQLGEILTLPMNDSGFNAIKRKKGQDITIGPLGVDLGEVAMADPVPLEGVEGDYLNVD